MKKLLTFLVAVAFLLTGVQAFAAAADSTQVTLSGMFIEISGATGDVSPTSPDALCSSTWGCNIDWIMFIPGAANDEIEIDWLDESGIEIFPHTPAQGTYDIQQVEYYGDAIPFFFDYSGSTISTGAKIIIKLKTHSDR